jgi:hypothetical protein
MRNRSIVLVLFSIICVSLIVAKTSMAEEEKGMSGQQKPEPYLVKLQKAADEAISDSLKRDVELRFKFVDLYGKWTDLTKEMPNLDPKKPLKDSLTPGQADKFNMLTSQMRYLQLSLYDEVIKRREIRQLISLIRVEEKQEELWADMVASGSVSDDLEAGMATVRKKLKEGGVAIDEWEVVLDSLTAVQENEDARTIPFKTLVEGIRLAKIGPTPASDKIGFFLRGDLKDSPALKIIIDRLDAGVRKGDPDAIATAPLILEEVKSRSSN